MGRLKTALNTLIDPDSGQGLLDSGKIKNLDISDGGRVTLIIEVAPDKAGEFEPLTPSRRRRGAKNQGITSAQAIMTAESAPNPAAQNRPAGELKEKSGPRSAPKPSSIEKPKPRIPGVRHIIAVASGKGGWENPPFP